jgi:chemotaxis protein MotB
MGKKKHQEEHENLERWLVSYADFMTLLFATFVVLYGLAFSNANEYKSLESSLQNAFAAPSLLEGSMGLMTGSDQMNIFDNPSGDSVVPPLLELLSPKYEQESFESIKETINNDKDLSGVKAKIDERGLVIQILESNLLFESSSANLTKSSYKTLDTIGYLIKSKFALHLIRVEGHTDNLPLSSKIYPSNWELSSARASVVARHLIDKYKFKQDLFSVVGYSDTRPIASNNNSENRRKNRRVEIVVLKNRNSAMEPKSSTRTSVEALAKKAEDGEDITAQEQPEIKVETKPAEKPRENMSTAATRLVDETGKQNMIIIKDNYNNESEKIAKEINAYEESVKNQSPDFKKPVMNSSVYTGGNQKIDPTQVKYDYASNIKKIYHDLINTSQSSSKK